MNCRYILSQRNFQLLMFSKKLNCYVIYFPKYHAIPSVAQPENFSYSPILTEECFFLRNKARRADRVWPMATALG